MNRFAFIIHPIHAKDIARKMPIARYLPDNVIEGLLTLRKPEIVSHISGIRSLTGAETEGIFIGLPLTPRMFVETRPLNFVYDQITRCCEIAAESDCQIIGLGAFTSVVGDGGITIAHRSPIAVTTGNSYTVATAIEATLKACELLELDPEHGTLAVVGATGSIGKTCARALAPIFGRSILVGRDEARTLEAAKGLPRVEVTTSVERIREADAIITVTSSDSTIINPEHLKPGAVVCDVARPRDVSVRVAKERADVLVIEGGVVRVPGDVDFGLDFGFPPKMAYACMSETIMLALEDKIENFTIGKEVSFDQVEETQRMARRHGFTLEGFRSFEAAVEDSAIDRVRAARVVGAAH